VRILARVILKKGREKPILRGHPWVFSGAVQSIEDLSEEGQLCDILSSKGEFLARGYANPRSQITCRLLSREKVPIDASFFRERIRKAHDHRKRFIPPDTNAFRLINSEGDFLPGLIVDVYGKGVCCQFLTAGMERWKREIVSILADELRPDYVYERSDTPSRAEEGLEPSKGLLMGTLDSPTEILENGHRFWVDVEGGQKTGFFLDQRENRGLVKALSKGRRVCDCFCYTGAFSIYAASGGARSVTCVDSSSKALGMAEENFVLNDLEAFPRELICVDVFEFLRSDKSEYDLIILDPPAFAKDKASLKGAARGYKDINLLALKRLTANGILVTFSCSHHISPILFQQILFAAAVDSGRRVQIIKRLAHPFDHPTNISHREGEYLKGFVLRVVE